MLRAECPERGSGVAGWESEAGGSLGSGGLPSLFVSMGGQGCWTSSVKLFTDSLELIGDSGAGLQLAEVFGVLSVMRGHENLRLKIAVFHHKHLLSLPKKYTLNACARHSTAASDCVYG